MPKNNVARLLPFILIAAIAGCDDGSIHSDLKQDIEKMRAERVNKKQQLQVTTLSPPLPAIYGSTNSREPFNIAAGDPSKQDKLSTPLQAYPLSMLQFVGTITKQNIIYAYILAPDTMVYRVKVGDIIGDQKGKIAGISPDKVDVMEEDIDENKPSVKRIITLQLRNGT